MSPAVRMTVNASGSKRPSSHVLGPSPQAQRHDGNTSSGERAPFHLPDYQKMHHEELQHQDQNLFTLHSILQMTLYHFSTTVWWQEIGQEIETCEELQVVTAVFSDKRGLICLISCILGLVPLRVWNLSGSRLMISSEEVYLKKFSSKHLRLDTTLSWYNITWWCTRVWTALLATRF